MQELINAAKQFRLEEFVEDEVRGKNVSFKSTYSTPPSKAASFSSSSSTLPPSIE